MPEPLKNLLHRDLVAVMGRRLAAASDAFDGDRFFALATENMERLELMQRSMLIRDALGETLPPAFETAAAILSESLPTDDTSGLSGWALLPVSQYVAQRGLDHFDLSLALLKRLTPHFTAEFGIRPFIVKDQARALATMTEWTTDDNHHVRRLASEGSRPRLPWAIRLPVLVKDPQPILPILTALLDDPEDYVRRSVANSLNDIAKDHPDRVAAFVARHIVGASPQRLQLLRHASRTLLKKGHSDALENFGFAPVAGIEAVLGVETPTVVFGDALVFHIVMTNGGSSPQRLMVDYAIHHRKANGQLAPKVFKWKSLDLSPDETVTIDRRHALRAITTRQYYPGLHRIEIMVNGTVLADGNFQLLIP